MFTQRFLISPKVIAYMKSIENRRLGSEAVGAAIKQGDMEMLEWLVENKCPMKAGKGPVITTTTTTTTTTLEFTSLFYSTVLDLYWEAAYVKKFSMVKWLYENGCPFNKETYSNMMYYFNWPRIKDVCNVIFFRSFET